MHMDYWRRELATRLRNTAPVQLFHVITLTLALDAASHLPSGLKEQCKIAATARAGKKKSPRNDGVHQRGSFWADCIPWTQAWPRRRWLPPSGRRKQRGGKSQTETNKQKNHVTATEVIHYKTKIKQNLKKTNKNQTTSWKLISALDCFLVVNRNPTNPFSWEQHLTMGAARLKQGGVAQASTDARVRKGWQPETAPPGYPTFRNTKDSSL